MDWKRTARTAAFGIIVLGTTGFVVQQDKPTVTREQAEAIRQQRLREMRDAFAAPGVKSVRLETFTQQDPVRVMRILYKDSDVTPRGIYRNWDGLPFQGSDDWLKDVTVVLRNTSNKVIVAGAITIDFPETGAGVPGSPVLGEGFPMGRKPEHARRRPDGTLSDPGTAEPLAWTPGQELKVPIASIYDHALAEVRSRTPLKNVTTCWVRLGFFYFIDATRWAPNNFQKPAETPGKYVRMTFEEFTSTSRTD